MTIRTVHIARPFNEQVTLERLVGADALEAVHEITASSDFGEMQIQVHVDMSATVEIDGKTFPLSKAMLRVLGREISALFPT